MITLKIGPTASMIIFSAQSGNIPRPATQAIRPATAIRSSQVAS